MTLDDAIEHAEEKVVENEKSADRIKRKYGEHVTGYGIHCKCAEEHRQLAEWLKELKAIRENTPPSDDWEPYADRLHDIACKYGYERAMADMRGKIDMAIGRMLEFDTWETDKCVEVLRECVNEK